MIRAVTSLVDIRSAPDEVRHGIEAASQELAAVHSMPRAEALRVIERAEEALSTLRRWFTGEVKP